MFKSKPTLVEAKFKYFTLVRCHNDKTHTHKISVEFVFEKVLAFDIHFKLKRDLVFVCTGKILILGLQGAFISIGNRLP